MRTCSDILDERGEETNKTEYLTENFEKNKLCGGEIERKIAFFLRPLSQTKCSDLLRINCDSPSLAKSYLTKTLSPAFLFARQLPYLSSIRDQKVPFLTHSKRHTVCPINYSSDTATVERYCLFYSLSDWSDNDWLRRRLTTYMRFSDGFRRIIWINGSKRLDRTI